MNTLEVVSAELKNIAADIGEIKHVMKNVQISQEAMRDRLARIEVKQENAKEAQDRAFTIIKDLENRVQKVEIEQPLTKLVRGLVIAGITGFISLAGGVFYMAKTGADRPVVVVDRDVVESLRPK